MEGYITKMLSGKFVYDSLNNGAIYGITTFYFTQWYDAKLNKSKFVIDKICVFSERAYDGLSYIVDTSIGHVYFDGKIKINGKIVYTASKKKKDTYVVYDDPNGVDRKEVIMGNTGQHFISSLLPLRTTQAKNERDGDNSILSLSFEVDHGTDRSGRIQIELCGNSSSNFQMIGYVGTKSGSTTTKTFTYKPKVFTTDGRWGPDGGTLIILDDNTRYNTMEYDGYIHMAGATIQRIYSAVDILAGGRCSISIEPNKDYYYKMDLSIGESSGWHEVREFDDGNFQSDSNGAYVKYCGIIPLDVLTAMTNTPKGKMRAVLQTYLDSSFTNPVGESEPQYFFISVPDDIIPNINDASTTITFINEKYNLGEALSGYSKVHLLADACGIYGSTIKEFVLSGEYTAVIESQSLDYLGNIVWGTGTKKFYIEAVDSRGMHSEKKVFAHMFYQYDLPRITLFDVYRNSEKKSLLSFGASMKISPVNGNNVLSAILKYKRSVDKSWKILNDSLEINSMGDGAYVFVNSSDPDDLMNGVWDEYTSFDFMLVISDRAGNSVEQRRVVYTIKAILDFKEPLDDSTSVGGVAVGKICEIDDFLEVMLKSRFYNDLYIKSDRMSAIVAIHNSDILVRKDDFKKYEDGAYSQTVIDNYPLRAVIPIDGVTNQMKPDITFDAASCISGLLAPFADSFNGGIYIFASDAPDADVVISDVSCWKEC